MADFLSPSNQVISRSRLSDDDEDDEKHSKFQVVVVGEPSASGSASASGGGGGGSLSSRKPRGRPPGSKNKPKPPVIITRETSTSSMQPMFLEISPNADILDSVFDLARRRRAGISVISGSGSVANVSLRHPTVQTSSIVLSGRFEILSLAGTFLPNAGSSRASPFTVSLAGAQGQVIGGVVAGPLVAAGTVVVTAAGFASPEFYRLPVREQEDEHPQQQAKEEQQQQEGKREAGAYGYAGPSGQEVMLWGTPAAVTAGAPRAPPPHSHRPPPQHQAPPPAGHY